MGSNRLKCFSEKISQEKLDIEDKVRTNLFAWRGQFSPQLIQYILEAYCSENAVVLDPFSGSGTVLYEAGRMAFESYGYEINPAAWAFSKIYEFISIKKKERNGLLREVKEKISEAFPLVLFSDDRLSPSEFREKMLSIGHSADEKGKIILNSLVILSDIAKNDITNDLVQNKFYAIKALIENLPYSEKRIRADLQDARCIPLPDASADFVVTSPPYINVFNYHQNYRESAETLGWDMLQVARSEIGSNRANRGNRFRTVVQYCVDMENVLRELSRVLVPDGKIVFIVGHESKVLGVPFYNADIIRKIAVNSCLFDLVQTQQRVFLNRFGKSIREDILNLVKKDRSENSVRNKVAKSVAREALENGRKSVTEKNRDALLDVLSGMNNIHGTPIFNSRSYEDYHIREAVMMVSEGNKRERKADAAIANSAL